MAFHYSWYLVKANDEENFKCFLWLLKGFLLWALWLCLPHTGLPADTKTKQYLGELSKTHPIAFGLMLGDYEDLVERTVSA